MSEANEANQRERGMKLLDAFRIYPKAMFWSVVLSSTLIMEGYDTAVVGSCKCDLWIYYFFFSIVLLTEVVNAYPSFLNVFGIRAKDGSLNIPPSWQNGIVAATNCGEVIGLQVSRTFATRAPSC